MFKDNKEFVKKLCPGCKKPLSSEHRFCTNCGLEFKNPKQAAMLSFFVCGLGQVYTRQYIKGVLFFIGFFLSLLLLLYIILHNWQGLNLREKLESAKLIVYIFVWLLIIWGWSINDAHEKAKTTPKDQLKSNYNPKGL